MKGVLIGSDLMYRQDGSLVPIEINTNVGWDVMNRIEREEDMWDFSFLRSYIKEHNITDVYLEGQIQRMKNFWPEDMGAEIHVITKEEMDESTDESEYHLYIRSAYSDEAYVDSFCRDKVNFLNAIQNLSFGCEYLLKTSGGLVGDITKVEDNGKLPNFLVKYRYPNYNKSKYPLAIRFDNVEKLKSWAEANLEEDYFIMPFYYDVDNLYKAEGEENSRIKLIRNWSLYIANDEGSLDSVYVASYTKLSAEIDESKIEWNEDGTCKDEETLHRMISSALWTLADNLDVLLEANDVVLMEDDTWKEASELKTGLKVKAVTIPTSGTVDIHKSVEDYNVSFEELVASSSYTINEIKVVHKVEGWVSETVLNFTDGTDWFDSDASSYPVLDPKDQTVMFKKVGTIEAGDKVILMEAGATELEKPTFVIREVESTSKRRVLQKGYAISLDGNHLFLSKTSADAQAYISIEHNSYTITCIDAESCVSPDKVAYTSINFNVDISEAPCLLPDNSTLTLTLSDGTVYKLQLVDPDDTGSVFAYYDVGVSNGTIANPNMDVQVTLKYSCSTWDFPTTLDVTSDRGGATSTLSCTGRTVTGRVTMTDELTDVMYISIY